MVQIVRTVPAYSMGGITRPALGLDENGNIVLVGEAAIFAAQNGLKLLYLGLPDSTPFPPITPPTGTVNPPVDTPADPPPPVVVDPPPTPPAPPVVVTPDPPSAPPPVGSGATIPAFAFGGIVRPELRLDAAGNIILDPAASAFVASFGLKLLYIGVPPETPFPPVAATPPSTPTDSNAGANSIAEGTAVNGTVGITASSTSSSGQALTYTLTADSSSGGFKIDPASGVVTVADSSRINFESATNNAYQITVQVTDGVFSASQSFTIAVLNVAPSTPTDGDAAPNTVAERAAVGTVVGLTVVSSDINGPAVTYALTADSSNGGFAVNAATGVVTVADPSKLDYETSGAGQAYSVTVSASDGSASTSQTFSITVTDINDNAPVFTSGATATTLENTAASTVVYTAVATDADGTAPNNTFTYALGGTDAGLFDLNTATGAVSFKSAPNAEAPGDFGADNIYDITITAIDNGNPALATTQAVAITVADVNDNAPVFTSGAAATTGENVATTTPVYTAAASDADRTTANNTLTYTLGGLDAALFDINAASGAVTFKTSPNFEAPADNGGNNVHDITVTATDNGNPPSSATRAVAISVTDLNDNAPVFTSGTAATTAENTAAGIVIYTAAATDADGTGANNVVSYGLVAGVGDNDLFNINLITGAVTFRTSPNFEAPADTGGNNTYDIVVTATDSGNPALASTRNVAISVTDVNDSAPVFTSSATPNVVENTTAVVALTASDADTVGTNPPIFLITGGADAALFQIDGGNQLSFVAARNFETQARSYAVEVTAFDGVNSTVQILTVALTDANDNAPVFASTATPSVAENTTAVVALTATDADTVGTNPPTFTITGGADQALFQITGGNQLSFVTLRDYETQARSYNVQVTAFDGVNSTMQSLTVALTDVNDTAPVFASSATPSVAENTTAVVTLATTDADSVGTNPPTFTITGGVDQGLFQITGGNQLSFVAARDFETQARSYTVEVSAFDGTNTTVQTLTVGLTDVNDNTPVFTSGATASTAENVATTAAVYTAAATDADGSAANNTLTYTIGGTDAGLFDINPLTGAVTFKASPNFEAPSDSGGNNVYDISVTATDNGTPNLTATQSVAITVTDANDNAPVFTSGTAASTPENVTTATAVYTAAATDVDGTAANRTLTYSLGGTDAGLFNIDAVTGAVTFKASPNFEAPADDGGNNIYDIAVTATDNGNPTLAATRAVAITVTDVNDNAPVFTSAAAQSVNEGQTVVVMPSATDADTVGTSPPVFTITGGADQARFAINGSNQLVFISPPDFESANSAAMSNVYEVQVSAFDGVNTTAQTLSVTVTNLPPGTPTDADGATNQISTGAPAGSGTGVTASSIDPAGGNVTYTLANDAGGRFTIDGATGVVTASGVTPIVFNDPAYPDNNYSITVRASDPSNAATIQSFIITVVPNSPPVANDDTATATEAGGTANGTAGSNPSGNVLTAIAPGDATDTDMQDPSANLVVSAVRTGAEGSMGQVAGTVGQGLTGAYGTLTLNADGSYTYVVDQNNPTVDALTQGSTPLVDVFNYTVQDTGGLTDVATLTVSISGADDAPVANSDFAFVNEDSSNNLINVLANDSDVDGGPRSIASVMQAANGTVVVIGGGTDVRYTPNANYEGSDSFGYSLTPGGSTTIVNVIVNGINDAPVNTVPGVQTFNEDTTRVFNTANGNAISIADIDARTSPVRVTLSATQGAISLNGTSGLSFTAGDGTADATMTFTGTLDSINTALNGLGFTPGANYSGIAEISITTNDQGNTGSGGSQTDTDTVTLSITAVNDAPANNGVPANFVVQSGFSHTITGMSISDVDAGSATNVTTTLVAASGTLNVQAASGGASTSGNGTGTVTLTGTLTQINTSLSGNNVVYTAPDTNSGSNSTTTITVTTNDAGNTGIDPGLSGNATSEAAVNTIQVGVIPQVWFIDSTPTAVNANAPRGSQDNPFTSISEFNTASNTASGPGANDYIYLKEGTYTGDGINLKDGQILLGDDQALSFTNPFGGPAIVVETASGARPTINVTTNGDQGIDLASNNTVRGVNVTTGSGTTGLDDGNNSVGNLTVSSMAISGAGSAVDIDQGGNLNVVLDSASSTGGTYGIQLGGIATSGQGLLQGSFNGGTGALSGATGAGFMIGDGLANANTGGIATISYGGTISTTGGVRTISIEDRMATAGDITLSGTFSHASGNGRAVYVSEVAGGTITFSGANSVANSGSLAAIELISNTGGTTINFTGNGLDIDTTSGIGFSATGGGTVNVTGTGNTINSTTGTALNVQNTTIGASDVTFQSISSGAGANNGIILNATGSSGGLHVTGVGTTVGSGGTIQGKTGGDGSPLAGTGIYLNNTFDVQLANMNLQNFENFAIRGNTVNGFSLAGSMVNGTNGNLNGGGASDEGSLYFTGLTGTSSISNTGISGGFVNNVYVGNSGGTLGLTFTNVNIGANSTSNGNDSILLDLTNTAVINATVTGSTFTSARGDLLQFNGNSLAGGSSFAFTGNTLSNNHPAIATGGGGITLSGGQVGTTTFNIENNSFRDAVGTAVVIAKTLKPGNTAGDANSVMNVTFNNNTVGVAGTANSGSVEGSGVLVQHYGGGTLNLDMVGNQIRQYNNSGILLQTGAGLAMAGTFVAEVTGNTLSNPGNNPAISSFQQGFKLNSGVTPGDTLVTYLTLGGDGSQENTFTNSGRNGGVDMRINAQQSTAVHVTANDITGNVPTAPNATYHYTGGANDGAALATFLAQHNLGSQSHTAGASAKFFGDSPPAPYSLLAASGGVESSSNTPGEMHLTQAQLDPVVAAAIAHWAAAGATEAQLDILRHVNYGVGGTPDGWLGASMPGRVAISADAEGYGWFIDPTPNDSNEFAHSASGTRLITASTEAPAGRMDLLTTLLHEMGEQLGLRDSTGDPDDLMHISLTTGERRLPDAVNVVTAIESQLPASAQAAAGTPIVIGTAGNDAINAGSGANILFGGSGADTFVFGAATPVDTAAMTHVADYNAAQGDRFDFTGLAAAIQQRDVADLLPVRAIADSSGSFATLQINTNNASNGHTAWVSIAQLDGIHAGDPVDVVIGPAGASHLLHLHVDLIA